MNYMSKFFLQNMQNSCMPKGRSLWILMKSVARLKRKQIVLLVLIKGYPIFLSTWGFTHLMVSCSQLDTELKKNVFFLKYQNVYFSFEFDAYRSPGSHKGAHRRSAGRHRAADQGHDNAVYQERLLSHSGCDASQYRFSQFRCSQVSQRSRSPRYIFTTAVKAYVINKNFKVYVRLEWSQS